MPAGRGRPKGWRMDPDKKRVPFSTVLAPKSISRLLRLCAFLDLSQGKVIDEALKMLLWELDLDRDKVSSPMEIK